MDINDRISQYRQDIKSDRVDMSFGEIINMYKDEFLASQKTGVHIDRSVVSANSNLNFKQLSKMLSYFEISVSPVLDQQKPTIEKLVWYRNSIAHGENSITVTQKDVETFISCITKCIDEMLSLFSTYISSLNYCKKDS